MIVYFDFDIKTIKDDDDDGRSNVVVLFNNERKY